MDTGCFFSQQTPTTTMMLQVTVPPNCGPTLLVQTPDGQVISTVVPKGLGPGQVFHVQVQAPPAVIVQGVDVPTDAVLNNHGFASGFGNQHQQTQQHSQQPHSHSQQHPSNSDSEEIMLRNKGLVQLVVPKGLQAGDKFKVRIPDGRTITVVVPPNVAGGDYFQVKVPNKKQNWHDNPLALAPMAVGPFL
jgi:hypothetical protein